MFLKLNVFGNFSTEIIKEITKRIEERTGQAISGDYLIQCKSVEL